MASGKEVKNLKSRLEGEELDLSLSDITVVPVREIAALKKVTNLDLSSNRIATLPDDFCALKNLVKLDLSSNKLTSLPEQFGKLDNLQHLDLYKNSLETLPVSFCHLKQLRWLDLKDNPLRDNLRKVAGDCLDPKQCREAASKVVQYMQKINAEREQERQKMLKKQREMEAAEKLKGEEAKQAKAAEKKKEKERKKTKQTRQDDMKVSQSDAETKQPLRKERDTAKQEKVGRKKKTRGILGCIGCLLSFVLCLLFITLAIASVLTLVLYANCSRPSGNEFIPESRQLCQDLYQILQTGRVSFSWDYATSLRESSVALKTFGTVIADTVSQFDYIGWKNAIIDASLTCRETIVEFSLWTYEHGMEFAKPFLKQMVDFFWVVVALTMWILERALHYFSQIGQWIIDTVIDFVGNFPSYIEKVKHYWKNLK